MSSLSSPLPSSSQPSRQQHQQQQQEQQQEQHGIIVPMDASSVQRVVAGQAITDLASAVKELVDNSLDAGAKTIKIRLFNQGLDIIEVSDDGCGVPPASRRLMATRHATSKIRAFEDIYRDDNDNDENENEHETTTNDIGKTAASTTATNINSNVNSNRTSGSNSTLGFRGEALFSLANLSQKLVVSTRTAQEPLAQRFEFQRNGQINPTSICSEQRKVGTIVAVIHLFHSVPVRRADLRNTIKQQRAKLMTLMEGYATLCLGVQFHLIDMVSSGPSFYEEARISTSIANSSLDQTVSSVLGSRFLDGLCPVSVDLTTTIDTELLQLPDRRPRVAVPAKMEGLISKAGVKNNPAHGRQFFSINGRPVELPRIARVLGDAWRSLQGSQKRPACVLRFTLPKKSFDVNLSPNKRDVMLTQEDEICRRIHASVIQLWSEQTQGIFRVNEVGGGGPQKTKQSNPADEMSDDDDDDDDEDDDDDDETHNDANENDENINANDKNYPDKVEEQVEETSSILPNQERRRRVQRRFAFVNDLRNARLQHEYEQPVPTSKKEETNIAAAPQPLQPVAMAAKAAVASSPTLSSQDRTSSQTKSNPPTDEPHRRMERIKGSERQQWLDVQAKFNESNLDPARDAMSAPVTPTDDCILDSSSMIMDTPDTVAGKPSINLEKFAFQPSINVGNPTGRVRLAAKRPRASRRSSSLDEFTTKRSYQAMQELNDPQPKRIRLMSSSDGNKVNITEDATPPHQTSFASTGEEKKLDFCTNSAPPPVFDAFKSTDDVVLSSRLARLEMHAQKRKLQERMILHQSVAAELGLSNNNNNNVHEKGAEQQHNNNKGSGMSMINLTKDDFGEMQVIGQFNLGFILVRCRNNHLWILDQHACDEKYNFERLVAKTKIQEQKLISPLPLELSLSEEACIMDHMQVFEANGFRLQLDSTKPPRFRFSLTAIPSSGDGQKSVEFGKDDISALCAMLSEASDSTTAASSSSSSSLAETFGNNNAVRRYAGVGAPTTTTATTTTDKTLRDTATADQVILARLPKAIAMLANRACRGSIMIGTALSVKEMERIVRRLTEVHHPWNCPHGRPTMRHVRDLQPVLVEDEHKAMELVAGPTVTFLTQDNANDGDDDDDHGSHAGNVDIW